MIIEKVLSFDEFQGFLSDTLGLAAVALHRDASFLGDLGVDSLKLVEVILQFELQLGIAVPTGAAWEIQTVGDAYDYYVGQVRGDGASGE
ncbi:MAG: acyl carrier protein [Anaerolineae bacterium]|jgi:acyl carrier protein